MGAAVSGHCKEAARTLHAASIYTRGDTDPPGPDPIHAGRVVIRHHSGDTQPDWRDDHRGVTTLAKTVNDKITS